MSTLHACKRKKSTFLFSSSNGPWNMMKSRMSSQPSTFPSTSLISSSSSAERTDIDLRIEQMKRSISSTTTSQLTLGKKLMQIIPCNNATFSSWNWNVLGTWHKTKLTKRDACFCPLKIGYFGTMSSSYHLCTSIPLEFTRYMYGDKRS